MTGAGAAGLGDAAVDTLPRLAATDGATGRMVGASWTTGGVGSAAAGGAERVGIWVRVGVAGRSVEGAGAGSVRAGTVGGVKPAGGAAVIESRGPGGVAPTADTGPGESTGGTTLGTAGGVTGISTPPLSANVVVGVSA